MEAQTEEKCRTCGKSTTGQAGLSLTQWIFSSEGCCCASLEQSHKPALCKTCGKRLEARIGSLTQWIFREDTCSCEAPVKTLSPHPRLPGFANVAKRSDNYSAEEIELEIAESNFPRGRYKAIAQLGSGGAGTVYLCRDRILKKKVAVKTLRQLTPEQAVAFQMEARATSTLQHPNIVRVLDFGIAESGSPYMVLDYVEGLSLAELIESEGRLDWRFAAEIIMQLCDALAHAHNLGIFHRDLKPLNVLISEGDNNELQAHLIDFGVARVQQSQEPTIVQGRTLVGSPAYMSPDQMAGLAFDARSEIYSLGCLLYECIVGHTPFEAESPLELLSLHANAPVPRLAEEEKLEDVPASLQTVIDGCLSKDPAKRFPSALDVRKKLETIIEDDSLRATAYDASSHTAFSPKRINPRIILGAFVVSAVSIALTVIAIVKSSTDSNYGAVEPIAIGLLPKTRPSPSKESSLFQPISDSATEWLTPVRSVKDEDLRELDGVRITRLDLSNSPEITSQGLKYLKASKIKQLLLESNVLNDEDCDTLAEFDALTELGIVSSKVTLAGLKKLKGLKLHRLKLDFNPRIDDQCVKYVVATWPDLRALEIGDTAATGASFPIIANLKRLDHLSVGSLNATPEQWLKVLERPLVYLDAANSNLPMQSLPRLAQMDTLRTLNIENCLSIPAPVAHRLARTMKRCTVRAVSIGSEVTATDSDFLFKNLGENPLDVPQ